MKKSYGGRAIRLLTVGRMGLVVDVVEVNCKSPLNKCDMYHSK